MSISNDKIIAQWEHHYMRLLSIKDSTKIELFYFHDNFCCIAQWVLALTFIIYFQVVDCSSPDSKDATTCGECPGMFFDTVCKCKSVLPSKVHCTL